MQAPTWIEKNQMLIMMRDNELKVHQQKMAGIATSNKAQTEAKEITNVMKKNRQDRAKTKEFLTNEKNITINKDN